MKVRQPITACTSYDFFTLRTFFTIFYIANKKTVDLKFQHRISRDNEFNRYLENAKSRNVLM